MSEAVKHKWLVVPYGNAVVDDKPESEWSWCVNRDDDEEMIEVESKARAEEIAAFLNGQTADTIERLEAQVEDYRRAAAWERDQREMLSKNLAVLGSLSSGTQEQVLARVQVERDEALVRLALLEKVVEAADPLFEALAALTLESVTLDRYVLPEIGETVRAFVRTYPTLRAALDQKGEQK